MISAPKVLALILLPFFFLSPAHADFSGARVNFRNIDLQFSIDEDKRDPSVIDILFGSGKVVSRMGAILSLQPENRSARDLTVEVTPREGGVAARFASGTIRDLDQRRGGDIQIVSSDQLINEICSLLALSGCDERSSGDVRARAPSRTSPRDPKRDVVITIGSLPGEAADRTLLVRRRLGGDRSGSDRAGDRTESIDDAVKNRAQQAFPDQRSDLLDVDDETLNRRSATRRYFTVHCTAFGASDETMRKWVANRKAEGSRSKSHGVILPSGEYLPMWPFDEMRVWATKTETCPETRPSALGAAINIELHYFCATNRNDKAANGQYDRLGDIFKEVNQRFGPLIVVSHREVDRGLRDGHNDPIGFSFAKFYDVLKSKGVSIDTIGKITDARHNLPTGGNISHHWPPVIAGKLDYDPPRPDDCRRDHH